jgi:hypothetical protein
MLPPSSGSKKKPNKKLGSYMLHPGFLLGLFFDLEDGYFPAKRRLTFNGIHDVISQKIEIFTMFHFVYVFLIYILI